MMPSETGASRTGPSAIGRFGKNDGKGNSSCVHVSPAPARSTRESPTVMMSTSQWVAPIARRITSRSTRNARIAPASTATSSVTPSGSPKARWAAQPANVDTISISPCAKFSVRVAL